MVTLPISGAGVTRTPMGIAARAPRAQHQLGAAPLGRLLMDG